MQPEYNFSSTSNNYAVHGLALSYTISIQFIKACGCNVIMYRQIQAGWIFLHLIPVCQFYLLFYFLFIYLLVFLLIPCGPANEFILSQPENANTK